MALRQGERSGQCVTQPGDAFLQPLDQLICILLKHGDALFRVPRGKGVAGDDRYQLASPQRDFVRHPLTGRSRPHSHHVSNGRVRASGLALARAQERTPPRPGRRRGPLPHVEAGRLPVEVPRTTLRCPSELPGSGYVGSSPTQSRVRRWWGRYPDSTLMGIPPSCAWQARARGARARCPSGFSARFSSTVQ